MLHRQGHLRSFGQLARALLCDPNWPPDMKIRERSLATVLSKLDREQDLTWLGDRTDVQAILARLLRCSVGELARPPGPETEAHARKLRWEDLRYAQTFDLSSDTLPPTLPAEVLDPTRWDRTFWVAPSGAGRSLVGQWLAARGLAHFRSLDHSGELAVAAADESPLFVELTSAREAVGRAPTARRLCVAGAVPPSPTAGWRVVHTPPIRERLPELVRWLVSRLSSDTGLDEDSLLEWLESGPISSGEADGFGAVVGLAGVLDRVGLRRARGKSVLELARQDARRRFDEAFGSEARDVAWQRRHAIEVLVAMARRALTDDAEPFASPRTLEEWTALVPDEHKSGIDVEWLRVSLAQVDSSIRPSDVERAARRLSPGAFRIVRALSQAGLLMPTHGERLVPAPRFMVRAIELEAERQLVGSSPFEWGEALLRPHAAQHIAERLLASLRSSDAAVLSDVVELEARESPAYAVAIETTFRCAGLALLSDAELDGEQLGDLWEAARDLWLTLPEAEAPVPRIEHPSELGPLFERGTFYLAALAVSEVLERGDAGPLSPWPSQQLPDGMSSVYDAIAETLVQVDVREPWVLGAYALVDRLRRTLGSVAGEQGHVMEAPGLVLDLVGTERLIWDGAQLTARTAEVLRKLWRARGETDERSLARALYAAWERASCPELAGSALDPNSEAGRVFFGHAPPALAVRVLGLAGVRAESLVALLDDETWRLLSDTPPDDPELLERLADALPDSWVERWLAHPRLRAHVWRRHREAALARLTESMRDGDIEGAVALTTGAPAEELEAVLPALAVREELGRLSGSARDALRHWLHGLVGARQRGWRDAYSLLSRLEG